MENTLENKAKFFAQYWGQEVYKHITWINTSLKNVLDGQRFLHIENAYLELKPLSSITDEDLNKTNYGCKEMILEKGIWLDITNADILRSLGYALPWMGLSVETLIEYGWIKLKENN